MKKVLFLQIKGNALGGVWGVNKALGEELVKRKYDVQVLALRNNHPGIDIGNCKFKINVINEHDSWEIIHRRDVLNSFSNKHFLKTIKKYFCDKKKLNNDYRKMKKEIRKINPDYIIASHYQVLDGIPKEYLSKVFLVQHSSFDYLLKDKKNVKKFKKVNDKIQKFCWLCKSTMDRAIEFGYKKNQYIYNPNKFKVSEKADVVKNKKIVIITRIHPEKRIDLMIKIIDKVFKENSFNDWIFEIYGSGTFNEESKSILKTSNQIFYKGFTNNPSEILLNASFTLNTSIYEGFPLSIIEGFSCGLPVISFNYGEAANEQIINNYNGYVIEQNNIKEFEHKVKYLIENPKKLEELSNNAKEFSKKFSIENVVEQWEKEFKKI